MGCGEEAAPLAIFFFKLSLRDDFFSKKLPPRDDQFITANFRAN